MAKKSMCDGIRGSLLGGILGDVAGAPFEFPPPLECLEDKDRTYTDHLSHDTTYNWRWETKTIPKGQWTDDTEMKFQLIRSMKPEKFDVTGAVLRYTDWSKSTSLVGRNTRQLFKKTCAKTPIGKARSFAKQYAIQFGMYPLLSRKITNHHVPLEAMSNFKVKLPNGRLVKKEGFYVHTPPDKMPIGSLIQSNGSLMRCSPLAAYPTFGAMIRAAKQDCYLTNPNEVNMQCSKAYLLAVRACLEGETDKRKIVNDAKNSVDNVDVQHCITAALHAVTRDVNLRFSKGWVVNALYVAFYSFLHFERFADALRWIIDVKKGDTDTNASIAGSLWGAYRGYNALMLDPIH